MYLHVVLASDAGVVEWNNLQRDGLTVVQRVALTDYAVPKAATFNLLGGNQVMLEKNYLQRLIVSSLIISITTSNP